MNYAQKDCPMNVISKQRPNVCQDARIIPASSTGQGFVWEREKLFQAEE